MTATQQRNLASQLAPTDSTRALEIARAITDPWFGCQALAWVARYSPDNRFAQIISDSLKVGRKATDHYQIVASAAWPVRAIVERGTKSKLEPVVSELLRLAPDITPLSSRSEALFLLFQAVFPAGRDRWLPVLHALRQASTPMSSWRQRRNLHDAVLLIWRENQRVATEITNGVDDEKFKKQIANSIANAKWLEPRAFFWTNA